MANKKRRFTVIDFLIVMVVIISIVGIGRKFTKAKVSTPFAAKTEKVQISYFVEEIPEYAAKAIEIGSPVRESIQNSNFGKVSDIVIEESISWSRAEDGSYVASSKEGYSSLLITMDGEGIIGSNGVTLDKSVYYIGQTLTIYAGNSILQNGRIADIKTIE